MPRSQSRNGNRTSRQLQMPMGTTGANIVDTLAQLGRDKTRIRNGAVRPEITPEQIRGLLGDVATGVGVPFIDAARQAAQGNYGQAAISGLLDAPPVKLAGMALAPLIGMVRASKSAPQVAPFKLSKELENVGVSEDVIPIFLKYKKTEIGVGNDPYLTTRGEKIAKTRALNDLFRALGGVDDVNARVKFSKLNMLYDMRGEQALFSSID